MKKNTYFFIVFVIIMQTAKAQTVYDFSLKDIDNQTHNYTDLMGEKLTIIDFWATWCKPCLKAIPKLNAIYSGYRDKGVEVLGVNCDGPRSISKVGPLSNALAIEYPILLDIDSELRMDLSVSSYPTLLMINEKSKIVWVHEGYVAGDEKLIIEKIEQQLNVN